MGHRAYVLYERTDGLFNVHYSHWGAHALELVGKISEETPLGGDNTEPPYIGAFMQMLTDATPDECEVDGKLTEAQETTAVEPEPEMVGVTVADVLSEIGVAIEAVYVVDRDFTVYGYHCLHSDAGALLFDPGRFIDGEPVSLGHDRGYFQALKETHDAEEAVEYFIRKEVADSLDKTVLAASPAVTDRHVEEYPGAFVKMGGRTRKGFEPRMDSIPEDSYMVATSVKESPAWALPDGFEIETNSGVWTPS